MPETIARLLRDAADAAEADGRHLLMEEVSERTRVPIDTLRYWRQRGEGPPCFRLGRRVVYPERELMTWLRQRAAADAASRGGDAA